MTAADGSTHGHGRRGAPLGSQPEIDDRRGIAVRRPGTVKTHLTAETLRLYAGDWACFQAYCAEHRAKPLPAAPGVVAAFLASAGSGRAALSRRRAAIDHYHRHRGFPTPGADAAVRAALRQARRAAPQPERAIPPTPSMLERLADTCGSDLAGQRDRALLLLLAAGLGRTAIVALQAEHLRFTETGLDWTTTQHDGLEKASLPRSVSLALCPVRAVDDWLRTSATRYGPVFRKVNRWGQLEHAALGADALRLILVRRTALLSPGRKRR